MFEEGSQIRRSSKSSGISHLVSRTEKVSGTFKATCSAGEGRLGHVLALIVVLVSGCAAMKHETAIGSPAATAARAELLETYWRAVEIDGKPVVIHLGTREPHITLRREGGRVSGFAGCNALTGTFKQGAETIRFGPLAMTRMACMPADVTAMETAFTRALEDTVSYRIAGDSLDLRDEVGTVRMRLEARPLR